MGYGLALAGGGARGAAHMGVLKALSEAGLMPDAVGVPVREAWWQGSLPVG